MAVRNIGSIGATKPIQIHVWIPPIYNPKYKIEVEVSDGTTYDITNQIIQGEYTDGITETIGNFSFKINNSQQTYTDLFSLYDKINIYLDYGTTATSLRFVGKIERISKSNYNLILTGRSSASRVLGKNITYSATNKARSTILSEIISENFSSILTTTNLSTDSTLATVNYFERPFWDIVEELCTAAEYDAYVDADSDFNYFASGSKQNTTEAVVHTKNLISTGDFAPDLQNVYNKVRVYGKKINNLPIIATASNTSSQTSYDIKDLKINDSSIDTVTQAQARADLELAKNKDPPTVGTILSLGLPTILPGEQIRISDPNNGLEPKYYTIQKFIHKFSNDEPFQTELTIQKERISIPSILKKRVKFEYEVADNENPNDLDSTIIYDFTTDTGTHSSTEIDTELKILKVVSGQTSGTWISDSNEVDDTVTGIEVRMDGSSLEGTQLWVSLTGGEPYSQVNRDNSNTVSGNIIKLKVILGNANTELNALAIYYKT